MNRLHWWRAVGLLAVLLLSACGPTGSSSGSSPSATPVKLTASYSEPIPDELALWIAKDAGYLEKRGLDVDLLLIESSKGIPALLSGQTQIAVIGGSAVLAAAVGGADLVVVGVLAPVYPYQFMVPASIKAADDLKGKKVGVSSLASSSDTATRVVLRKLGLEPDKDVTVVAVGSTPNRIAAMVSGAIQGSVNQPPDSLIMESKGFHVLFDLAKLKLPSAQTTIVVKRSYAIEHRDVVQKFVDAIVQSIARDRQDKAFAVGTLKKWLKSDDDKTMNTTYDVYVNNILPSVPYPEADQFADALAVLAQRNEKAKGFDVSKILDASFVQSAESRRLTK